MMAEKKKTRWLPATLLTMPALSAAGLAHAAESAGKDGAMTVTAEGSKGAAAVTEGAVRDLQQQVNTLSGQVHQLSGAQNEILLYVALGIGALGLLLALLALLFVRNARAQMRQQVSSLQKQQAAERKQTEAAWNELQQQLGQVTARLEAQPSRRPEPVRPVVQPVQPVQPIPQAAPVAPPAPAWQQRAQSFMEAYNRFLQTKVSGMAARGLKEGFLREHQIVGFSCVNYTERMSNPAIPPAFRNTENQKEAHYWACPLGDNLYAVVPNVREYEMQRHVTVGYREVFRSNYSGGVCHSILVLQPAIFRGLNLQRPGQLQLGN